MLYIFYTDPIRDSTSFTVLSPDGIPRVCSGSRHRHLRACRATADRVTGLREGLTYGLFLPCSSHDSDVGSPLPVLCCDAQSGAVGMLPLRCSMRSAYGF